ncbi:MAG: flagellin [Candidatus Eisenbacteria bacterium]|uniref:Flagellin n=1 Tax=Eiseniibacteriota bacterium TaxID=2212470 RepID=A0A948W7T3_UNCEI|nr:flagellin [Candidatus Eisenbacteria bacterium]MBU2692934.1 flagellin [Candidatus Eisenbacteria bacterium]
MATPDLTRIRSNIQGLMMIRALREVNRDVGRSQLRLATGKRINNAYDDPAGYILSSKLENRSHIFEAIYNNIGTAKNLLEVAEGGLISINDIMVTLSEKIEMAANDTLGDSERQAISKQLVQFVEEIQDIAEQTKFSGVTLLSGSATFSFQTGERNATIWQTQDYAPASLGMGQLVALTEDSIIDSTNYTTYLDEVDTGLDAVTTALARIGSMVNRMTMKEDNISIAQVNTEAAFDRLMNADMAMEQLNLTKMQILQQTATSMLAQANYNSQSVLALFQ